jgi:hypothetical protein
MFPSLGLPLPLCLSACCECGVMETIVMIAMMVAKKTLFCEVSFFDFQLPTLVGHEYWFDCEIRYF